ncbi:MAG: hypothetical protein E6767_06105 [Dysgonomonas sp.]|nr:hypothetical protein [Dysgonomonas sp.]
MKKTYTILVMLVLLSLTTLHTSAQFIVVQDTVRGRTDFLPRLGDFQQAVLVPNDSVLYMLPPNPETDPWRYADFYTPSREIRSGYINGTKFMRIDDYEMIDVERLSSHGAISFKGDDVRVSISVAKIPTNDSSIKHNSHGAYMVNERLAKGVAKWAVPALRYQSISVTLKGKIITFPKRVYEHLLEPEIENMAVYYNPEKAIVYIITNNGGTSAYYSALWVVTQKGVSTPYIFDPMNR